MAQNGSVPTAAHLTAVFDALPTAIIMADRQGRIVLTNTEAQSLF